MDSEKESSSNLSTQVGAEFFEGPAEQTEDIKQALNNTAPPAVAGPPKPLEVPEYVYPGLAYYRAHTCVLHSLLPRVATQAPIC